MFSLFAKKPQGTPTVVNSEVGAALASVADFPGGSGNAPGTSCRKVEVQGDPPIPTGEADANSTTFAFLAEAAPGRPALLFRNLPEDLTLELWQLEPEHAPHRLAAPRLSPQQERWAGMHLRDLACLSGGRLALALEYFTPQPKLGIFIYDPEAEGYLHLGETSRHVGNVDRYLETRWQDADHMLLLHYSGRTREAAEAYYNRYSHFLLFSPRYANGLEILTLGIDIGSVRRWTLRDKTLFLRTQDTRGTAPKHEQNWSLDLSALL